MAYYPGCSAKTTERPYLRTAAYVLERLGVGFRVMEGVPCCGTLEGELADRSITRGLAAVIMREAGGLELVTGCSGCYSTINRSGGRAVHLVSLLRDEVGVDRVREAAVRRANLVAAPYYGCQALRPRELAVDDPEDPSALEELLGAVGVESVDFGMRTKCCGGPLMLRRPREAAEMAGEVVRSAERAGAEAVVTMCNLCHFMLDFYGGGRLPVLHFTQPLAYALGADEGELGFDEHFTPVPRGIMSGGVSRPGRDRGRERGGG